MDCYQPIFYSPSGRRHQPKTLQNLPPHKLNKANTRAFSFDFKLFITLYFFLRLYIG